MEKLFDICLESVTCDYVSEGFKDVLKKAGTIASDAAKNAGNAIIKVINTVINIIRKCINTLRNAFRKSTGKEAIEFQKKDAINYKFKTSAFKKKEAENIAKEKKEKEERENKINELEDKIMKLDLNNRKSQGLSDEETREREMKISNLYDEIERLNKENKSNRETIKSLKTQRNTARIELANIKENDDVLVDSLIKKYNLKDINVIFHAAENLSHAIENVQSLLNNFGGGFGNNIDVTDVKAKLSLYTNPDIFSKKIKNHDTADPYINYELEPMRIDDFLSAVDNFLKTREHYFLKQQYSNFERVYNRIIDLLRNLDLDTCTQVFMDDVKTMYITFLNKCGSLISKMTMDAASETEKLKQAVYEYGIEKGYGRLR